MCVCNCCVTKEYLSNEVKRETLLAQTSIGMMQGNINLLLLV